MDNELRQQILALIDDYFQKNYRAATPQIPPHRHNGVDNLKIAAADVLNIPKTKPAGSDMQIQYNNNGSFGATNEFLFDYNNNILEVNTIQTISGDGSNLTIEQIEGNNLELLTVAPTAPGSSGNIDIKTSDSNYSGAGSPNSGAITIQSGFGNGGNGGEIAITSGNGTNHDGGITLTTQGSEGDSASGISLVANSGALTATGNENGIQIKTQNGASGATPSGAISIVTGDASSGPGSGALSLKTGVPGGSLGTPAVGGDITVYTQSDLHNNDAGKILIEYNENNKASTYAAVFLQEDTAIIGARGSVVLQANTKDDGSGTQSVVCLIGSVSTTGITNPIGIVLIPNSVSTPSGGPTGAGYLYVTGGALHYVGSSGTDTTVAPA